MIKIESFFDICQFYDEMYFTESEYKIALLFYGDKKISKILKKHGVNKNYNLITIIKEKNNNNSEILFGIIENYSIIEECRNENLKNKIINNILYKNLKMLKWY